MYQHDVGVYADRFESFGWDVAVVDGHDVTELRDAFARARGERGRPFAVVARTLKGKGVSFLEDKDGWHGKPVKKGEELQKAVAELGDTSITLSVEPRRYPSPARAGSRLARRHARLHPGPGGRHARGLRQRPSRSSRRARPQVVAIDGDTKNSTFAEQLQGRGSRALLRGLHRRAEHGGHGPGHGHRGQDPVRLDLRLLPDPRLRLHPHGRLLEARPTSSSWAATPGSRSARTGRRRWPSRTWP